MPNAKNLVFGTLDANDFSF